MAQAPSCHNAQKRALTVPLARGCGLSRVPGGLYLANGISLGGKPVWDYLLDPPLPYFGTKFQGIQEAPDALYPASFDRTSGIILLDMVSQHDYQVPDFVAEVARLGLSRRIQRTFPFQRLKGKTEIWLALLSWVGSVQMGTDASSASVVCTEYRKCSHRTYPATSQIRVSHGNECLYNLWYTLWVRFCAPSMSRAMPSFQYQPLAVAEPKHQTQLAGLDRTILRYTHHPAVFMLIPITHMEAVGHVPDGTDVLDSGMDIIITER